MSSPKITVLYTSADASPQSGAFRSLLFMSQNVQKKGIRSLLVTPLQDQDSTAKLVDDFRQVFYFPLPRAKKNESMSHYIRYIFQNFKATIYLFRLIKQKNVDIVHINEVFDFYAAAASRLAGIPSVWHVRVNFRSDSLLYKLIPRIVNLLATKVIVVSNSVRQHLFDSQGISNDKINILHNPGPDPRVFHTGISGSRVRQEFKIFDDQPLVVLVSKLIEQKGHETFLRAIPLVLEDFPQAKFFVVGGELSGEHHQAYARRLKKIPSQFGFEQHVVFTGFRSDVPEIMAAADLVIHCPSYPDPFPGVILQGMAVGRSVIASKMGGAVEQMENNISGMLIPPEDPRYLAQTIIELLADEDKRTAFGNAASNKIQEVFTTEKFLNNLTNIYMDLLNTS